MRPSRAFHAIRHRLALGWAGLAFLACSDSGTGPGTAPHSLTLVGAVVDAATFPIAGALVSVRVWSPDSATAARGSVPLATTDGTGTYYLYADSLVGPVDSVRIHIRPPGCRTAVRDTTLTGTSLPRGADPVATVAIVLANPRTPAQSQPGHFCAFGVHPVWGPGSYQLGLRIDSVTPDSLWGLWDVRYQFSSGDDEGSFRGSIAVDHLDLLLTQNIVWNACTALSLRIGLASAATWGAATVPGVQPCLPQPMTFQFVADTTPFLIP